MPSPPPVGSVAPDFTLPSTAGQDITLSSFRGKQAVLIAFFPLAFTSTCTAELCAFNEDYDQFASKDVAILPISVDSTATLSEFRKKLGLETHLASDFKRVVSTLYGVLLEDRFYAGRSYFLVDKRGIVRWAFVEEKQGNRRENSEILTQIAALT